MLLQALKTRLVCRRVDAMSEENLADLDRRLQNVIKGIDEAKKKKAGAAEVRTRASTHKYIHTYTHTHP